MEGSSSTSKEKSPVCAESKEDVSIIAEDKDKKEKFTKDLQDFATRWSVSDKLSQLISTESIRDMVSQSNGYSMLLKELEKSIPKVCQQ